MNIFFIVITALWICPFLSYIIYQLTKGKPVLLKRVLWSLIVLDLLAIVGMRVGVSTLSTEINWVIITTIYLTISLLFWILQDHKNKLIKVTTIILMLFAFFFGMSAGSIGALGTAFILGEYEAKMSKKITASLTYTEFTLGNALNDYRGKRIEIAKKIAFFPVLQYLIVKKEYYDINAYAHELNVNYSQDKNILVLSTWNNKDPENKLFPDTIVVK